MTRGEAWFTHASSVLVGGTGLVFGWMLYFAEPTDEFAISQRLMKSISLPTGVPPDAMAR